MTSATTDLNPKVKFGQGRDEKEERRNTHTQAGTHAGSHAHTHTHTHARTNGERDKCHIHSCVKGPVVVRLVDGQCDDHDHKWNTCITLQVQVLEKLSLIDCQVNSNFSDTCITQRQSFQYTLINIK